MHASDPEGFLRLYLASGSGLFWNCGTSLRARNKADAAIRLADQLRQIMSRDRQVGDAVDTLAHAISSNDESACYEDRCKTLVSALSNSTERSTENCFGACSVAQAPLAAWLRKASKGEATTDILSASAVFDHILWGWAKKVGYDSIQLARQPQVLPCNELVYTTEILDLRARRHKAIDLLPHLTLRDPSTAWPAAAAGSAEASNDKMVAPCRIGADNTSVMAFQLCAFCEGTLMERTARCLLDSAQAGLGVHRQASLLRIVANGGTAFSRRRFEACTRVEPEQRA